MVTALTHLGVGSLDAANQERLEIAFNECRQVCRIKGPSKPSFPVWANNGDACATQLGYRLVPKTESRVVLVESTQERRR